ncbi:MAG: hypothetical protein KH443_05450 [Oscillospiraceae bacterium]|nr:hypothetical protein [Oscillospiraceae bacterium]
MGGLLMVKAAAYGWLGGLIAAPFLWLPALGVSVWILVREPRSRAVLLPLAAAWGLCLPLLWHMMAGDRISTLRNWIVTGPVYLLAALSIALLVGTAWYAMRQMDRRWKKRLLEVGAALSVWAVVSWGFLLLVFTARPETVGQWQGQKVVMQKVTWMETDYNYYAYHGPFCLGEYLGESMEPWGEDLG